MAVSKRYPEDEIERRTKLLELARDIRSKEALENDQIVLNCLIRYQRLSLKQIEELIERGTTKGVFKRTFLINSLKRLEDKGSIFSVTQQEPIHGKIIKYYVYKFPNEIDQTKIIISKKANFLKFKDEVPHAFVFSNDTIAIAAKDNKSFKSSTTYSEPLVRVESNSDDVFQLPQYFIDFYELKPTTYYFKKEVSPDHILLKKIKILKSIAEPERTNTKNILILEDHVAYATKLKERLERDGHRVKHVKTVKDLTDELNKNGKNYDVISLDKRIENYNVAKPLSYEIRYKAPQAKLGLLTSTLHDREQREFQNLDFDFILPKKGKKLTAGFSEIGDELAAWLNVV